MLQHEATAPADAQAPDRTILFAVRGVGEHVDVVRTLVEADDESICVAVLGEPDRFIFDSVELRTAVGIPYEPLDAPQDETAA